MNKFMIFKQQQQTKDDLVAQYEKLREEVLNASKLGASHPPGFAIVLYRGVACWIETCLYSTLLSEKTDNLEIKNSNLNEFSINKEIMIILTNIVLSHHKSENCYA